MIACIIIIIIVRMHMCLTFACVLFCSLTKTLEDFTLNMRNINSSVLVQPNLAVQSTRLSNWTQQVQFYPVNGQCQNLTKLQV